MLHGPSLTLTATRVINCIVVQSPAVAQLVQAFVVVCRSVTGTHWILVGRAFIVTYTASFPDTERFTNSKWWTIHVKARVQIWKCIRQLINKSAHFCMLQKAREVPTSIYTNLQSLHSWQTEGRVYFLIQSDLWRKFSWMLVQLPIEKT